MKKRGRIILALTLLCGCAGSPASNPPSSSKADLTTALPENLDFEITQENWPEKKHYLDILNELIIIHYDDEFECSWLDREYNARFYYGTAFMIDCPYNDDPLIFYFADIPIHYTKDEINKTAYLRVALTYDKQENPIWSADLRSAPVQNNLDSEFVYDITFDMEELVLRDDEDFSPTKGNPMKFVKSLNDQLIDQFLIIWNQCELMKQVVMEWKHQRGLVASGVDPNAVLDARELVLDYSTQCSLISSADGDVFP